MIVTRIFKHLIRSIYSPSEPETGSKKNWIEMSLPQTNPKRNCFVSHLVSARPNGCFDNVMSASMTIPSGDIIANDLCLSVPIFTITRLSTIAPSLFCRLRFWCSTYTLWDWIHFIWYLCLDDWLLVDVFVVNEHLTPLNDDLIMVWFEC